MTRKFRPFEATNIRGNGEAGPGKKYLAHGLAASAFTLAMGTSGLLFAAECTEPVEPVLPDGATASREAMIKGQQAVKAFQSANMAYMKCLEERFAVAEKAVESTADRAQKALATSTYEGAVEAYNAAVSAEEAIAGAFNTELREYKAANR